MKRIPAPEAACLGIDVSKDRLDGALWGPTPLARRQRARQVPNDPAGVETLCRWAAASLGCELRELTVSLESTSAYHLNAVHGAHVLGCRVRVINPRRAHQYARAIGRLSKNDRVDAAMLAQFGGQVSGHVWEPVPPEVMALYLLVCRRWQSEEALRRDESRRENVLLRPTPAAVIASIDATIAFHVQQSDDLSQAIEAHFAAHPALDHDRQLLLSIPCVGADTANYLLCLLRGRAFGSAREAAALCGVVPVHRQSGNDTRRRAHVSRESHRVFRGALHMPCVLAARRHPQLRALYERLKNRGLHHRQALLAVMRHLIHMAYGILKHQRPYDADWATKSPEERAATPVILVPKRIRRKNDGRLARLRRGGEASTSVPASRRARILRPPNRRWQPEELDLLRTLAGTMAAQSIAARLGRTQVAVQLKCAALGLSPRRRSPELPTPEAA